MNFKKLLASAIFAVIVAILTTYTVFSRSGDLSLPVLIEILKHSPVPWLFATFVSMFGFILFEGLAIYTILRSMGYKTNVFRGILYSAGDQFFSAITPSASGGQPASALFMRFDHIRTSSITVCLLANLIAYTLSTASIGLLSIIFDPKALTLFNAGSKFFIIAGILIMTGLTILFYLLLKDNRAFRKIETWIFSILLKLKFVRDKKKCFEKIDRHAEDYKLCSEALRGKTKIMLIVFLFNLLQRISQISVTPLVNRCLGETGDVSSFRLWTVQALAQIGANWFPIPGGMGVADYLMLDGFGSLFDSTRAYTLSLISRGISFYFCTGVSLVIVTIGYIFHIVKMRRKKL